jgi:two-component system response regulator YesN
MYSLLIVDDERWVRQGLRLTIDWHAEGIEVLGEAEDGEEALKLIKLQTPDILITDIKMPHMDGLALMEELKNNNLATKVIIISGYSDFSFAQKALRRGALDYILKPIEETQVLSVVRQCVAQLQREEQDHRQLMQISESIRESLPLARQRFLETLLTTQHVYLHNWRYLWDSLNIRLHPNRLRVTSVKVYDWGSTANDAKGRSLLRYAIGNIAEDMGAVMGETLTCLLDDHEDVDLVILTSPSEEDRCVNAQGMHSLIDACREYLGICINIGISKITQGSELSASFYEAIHAAAHAFYDGYGKVYEAERLERPQSQNQPYAGPSGWDTRFIHALKLGKDNVISELLEELTLHVQSNRRKYTPHELRHRITIMLREIEKKLDSSSTAEQTFSHKLYVPYCTLAELRDELLNVIRERQRMHGTVGNRKRYIHLALNYMEEHFTEDITMNRVAELHYLNPSYFSKMFHEETGETFSKHLIRLRMEKAKSLLKDSTLKIYEIAGQVGYQDFRHFVKLFKDQEGMTPAQYRDMGVM